MKGCVCATGVNHPVGLQHAELILMALDAALLDEATCAQFMADPTTPQGFLDILRQLQALHGAALQGAALQASGCFMRLCLLEVDTKGIKGPYCQFAVQSDIADPVMKCIHKAMQVCL